MVARSLLFNALFYLLMIVMMVVCAPVMLFGRKASLRAIQVFSRISMAVHRATTGIRHDYRGFDRVPAGGSLVALKHQSTWETIALIARFDDPAFVLKRELMQIPFFGWWCRAAGMIPVDRDRGVSALHDMTRRAREALAEGRQVLIFPEGTRREAGAAPDYKLGTAHLYRDFKVPMVPVALNSGLFWPRRSMIHRPGTIVAEVLDPVPPDLEPREAFRRMRDGIEAACDRLLVEAETAGAELPPTAAARVAAIRAEAVSPAG